MKSILWVIIFLCSCQFANATNITISVPSNKVTRVVDAIARKYDYKTQICDPNTNVCVANPQTKADFARQVLINFIQDIVYDIESSDAYKAAQTSQTLIDLGTQP